LLNNNTCKNKLKNFCQPRVLSFLPTVTEAQVFSLGLGTVWFVTQWAAGTVFVY